VTSSIDTTCTVWNIDTTTALTQLIAHDREVYDVAWLPRSTDIFVSVGADGSLRAFDLRSLDHSTILYETPAPKSSASTAAAGGGSSAAAAASSAAGAGPGSGSASSSVRPATSPLLRIAFHPHDHNYMSTFHMDGSEVQILDMRSPGVPVFELRQHRAPINALGWSSKDSPLLATAGWSNYIISLFVMFLTISLWQAMIVNYSFGTYPHTKLRRRRATQVGAVEAHD
jgi:DDB1- and CUL4-associated factor 7